MKLKLDLSQNNLICGDCEDWLPFIPSNSVDLIYIDPPFFSNRNYAVIWGNGFELRSFKDRWKGGKSGKNHYIGWMRPKIIEAYRILKSTGSIMLHCDWHAGHHLRLLLEEIFGEKNFQNELIWWYGGGGASKRRFARKHDNLYWFSKGKKYIFNCDSIREPYKWDKGQKKADGSVRDLLKGKIPDSVFQLNSIMPWSSERIGYLTQKPEALIERIIKACSSKSSIILDFFGGGGGTAKVAADLGRRFIIGDVSPVAYRVTKERLIKAGHTNFIDCNPPLTRSEWRLVKGHTFADRVCTYMGWEVNPKKSGDGGIDGWANGRKSAVQIKNSDVHVAVIRDLAGALSQGKYKHGICVGWTFSKGCYEFTAKLACDTGIKIELSQADFIVKPISNMKKEEYQALYAERVKAKKQKVQILEVS